MKKFVNSKETITDEMLEGLQMVLEDYVDIRGHVVARKGVSEERGASILTMGGSGHEPSSYGFIGRGWECAKVIGDIFAAPGPAAVLEGIRCVDHGEGVLLYVGNHAGDVMSAKMAQKLAERAGIHVEVVVFYDDVSSFPRDRKEQRRGLAGTLGLGKVLGAACERHYTLEELKAVAEKYREGAASLVVATSGATHPVTEQALSVIPEGKMIIGMGHHGEGAGKAVDMVTSKEIIKIMADRLSDDLQLRSGEKVLVILNSAGSTTYMELMILYKDVYEYLKEKGVEIRWKIVGEYLTTQEQAGVQLSFIRLDEELCELVDDPCDTAFIRKRRRM